MSSLTLLRPAEGAELDPARLSELCREFGIVEAERLISCAVTEIALQMTTLVRRYNGGEFGEFANGLRRMRRLADHAGFAGISLLAGAAEACLAPPLSTGLQGICDATALAATWTRLMRLAARAMSSGGDLRGLSG